MSRFHASSIEKFTRFQNLLNKCFVIKETHFICRFSSVSRSDQNISTWVLILRSVVQSDAGWYECQVSSTPKLSRWVQLEVVVPEVKIKGPEDMFVTAGSDVIIECVTDNVITKPEFVTWIFNGKVSFF